jgi:hypothetical protein
MMLEEYHLWVWRRHSLFRLSPADAETRTGDGQFRPLQFSPRSSRSKFNSWDSRSKLVQVLVPCEAGVNVTKIDASYQNGCSGRGESLWKTLSVAKRRRAESSNSVASKCNRRIVLALPLRRLLCCRAKNESGLWSSMIRRSTSAMSC